MGIFLILYSLGIFLYYLKKPKDYQGKAILALRFVIKKTKNKENELVFSRERTAFLAIIVKAFWGPLMLFYLVKNLEWLQNIIHNITHYEFEHSLRGFLFLFNDHLFWFILSLLLLIDVLIYSMGYWIELERLQNRIKSVDPTLSGWVIALLCYVPFNIVTNKIIGWYSSDLPFQDSSYLTIPFIFGLLILSLYFIYMLSSMSLGFKASNMTNRGIVTTGPYKYVRHPAYASKNIAWLLGSLPFLYTAVTHMDIILFLKVLLFLTGTFTIYYFRAITEERHLSQDPEYLKYKEKVRYKFIPGLW